MFKKEEKKCFPYLPIIFDVVDKGCASNQTLLYFAAISSVTVKSA